ncbi:MAG TPA: N-acetylmuramoyl-L-alanine amidase [Taishania sp.]|nr:N-acetylmuramoyl-L-alanine amidase [Taishania sp.]
MKKFLLTLLSVISFTTNGFNQENLIPVFSQVYNTVPSIPKGVLEAVAWSKTRYNNINETYAPSCVGMPLPYGVMGVFENGMGAFRNNGVLIEQLSEISVEAQKENVQLQVLAYAKAFNIIYSQSNINSEAKKVYHTLRTLSSIPDSDSLELYLQDVEIYEIMRFMTDDNFAEQNNFQVKNYSLPTVFGNTNYQVLSASKVIITANNILSNTGISYQTLNSINNFSTKSVDYGPALTDLVPSCNYTSGRSATISAVTIHTMQGSYSGSINWFKNCSSNVSAHYCLRSSDGQITQCVLEANTAWHVGINNSFTIGLEHEGYVSDASWYTIAMYDASALLVKDICTSHSIEPKRTAFFPWASTTNYNASSIPGSCVKIKGHQHFPSQTHTDPGANWNWDYYYKKINEGTPTINYLTNATGNFYDSGGASANYSDDERSIWCIKPANATSVTLNFSSFDIENTWDYLYIYDGEGVYAPLIGIYTGTTSPGTVTASSGIMTIEFRSECATTATGWNANWTAVINTPQPSDVTAPTTAIVPINDWKTTDFTASFTDNDEVGGSGLEKSFYSVAYKDNNQWTANATRGFYRDDFNSTNINPQFTTVSGNWAISSSSTLEQTDENLFNTNIYTACAQNLSNRYLYAWKGKIGGTGTNRRGGIHLFCSDSIATNRGDSYLIYFRTDGNADVNQNNKVQIYKATNDVLSQKINTDYTINPNQWYDFKVIYDRITGKITVYIDNVLVASWTDPTPIASGNYISFRNGNSTYEVDDFEVFRSRYPTTTVLVGSNSSNEIRTQNNGALNPAGCIRSIVVDSAGNLSSIATQLVNVDWTVPSSLIINDGTGADIDTFSTPTIDANWASNDFHSDIASFEIAIGTTSGATDVLNWTNAGLTSSYAYLLSNPTENQLYFVSVKAINNAGLDTIATSNGQRYVTQPSNASLFANEAQQLIVYPNPVDNQLRIENLTETATLLLFDITGKLVIQTVETEKNAVINTENLTPGMYTLIIRSSRGNTIKKITKK